MPVAPRIVFVLLVACLWAPTLTAQSVADLKQLEHADYDIWNTLAGSDISHDGKWVAYTVAPGKGDSTLKVREIASAREYAILRGQRARFTDDNRYLIYTIAPDPEAIKKLRAEKKSPDTFPKPALEILELETGKHTTIDRVSGFEVPEKAAGWIAFKTIADPEAETVKEEKSALTETWEITPEGLHRPTVTEEEIEKQKEAEARKAEAEAKEEAAKSKSGAAEKEGASTESGKPSEDKKGRDDKKDKAAGDTLVLRQLDTRLEFRFAFVDHYEFDETGTILVYTTSTESGDGDGVFVFDLEKLTSRQILDGEGHYNRPAISTDGKQVAFLTDRDDYDADKPAWSMYLWKQGQRKAALIVETESKGIPESWWISSRSNPIFSENGKLIWFATAPMPENMEGEDDDPDADPVAKLDLWHWQDPFLQPQQLLQAERDRNRDFRAVYHISGKKTVQLATEDIPNIQFNREGDSAVAVGIAPDKYNKMRSWDIQAFADSWLIDLKSGEATLVLDKSRGMASLSPAGKYITWWDGEKQSWFAMPTRLGKGGEIPEVVDLGKGIKQPLFDELHDTPSLPGSYGSGGWLEGDDALLLYDRWDIWRVDPSGKAKPVCLTGGDGRNQQRRYRILNLDPEARFVDLSSPVWLSTFDHVTKASGFASWTPAEDARPGVITQVFHMDEDLGRLSKARDTHDVIFTRSTYERCPDLWASTLEFQTLRRISDVNPQQQDYRWGTAELVHWTATDGQELDGLLYKPEGFDPDKQYPLMVYFYERNSDNLHQYYTPAAGRSIINFSFYVSRGYVLFVPDIPYTTGEPGPSAANAILPGVDHLVEQGFIDEERIGMQGHSWGGYQTAWLVTQTDRFACAESGAPVSNMTSAYGGIRWGTGMSRMFQYEKTQSRIGDTLWNARDKYIANSPVFFADRINTPLLILHNDEDTAVPWYQGIELFVALRRLEKPAWMLNYNGDPHWVMSDANRLDFARRMQQFFDHYLMDAPMPRWMAEGIPAVDKGKEFGFEYELSETGSAETSGENVSPESKDR